MSGMTPERLDEIEARADSATPGPWTKKPPERLTEGPAAGMLPGVCIAATSPSKQNRVYANPPGGQFPSADQNFIAHARTDVPDLIAEVRRLKSALDATTVPSMLNAETIDSLCKVGMTALARRILEGGGFLAIDEAMEWEDLSEQAKGDWRVVVRAAVTEFIGKGGAADA